MIEYTYFCPRILKILTACKCDPQACADMCRPYKTVLYLQNNYSGFEFSNESGMVLCTISLYIKIQHLQTNCWYTGIHVGTRARKQIPCTNFLRTFYLRSFSSSKKQQLTPTDLNSFQILQEHSPRWIHRNTFHSRLLHTNGRCLGQTNSWYMP